MRAQGRALDCRRHAVYFPPSRPVPPSRRRPPFPVLVPPSHRLSAGLRRPRPPRRRTCVYIMVVRTSLCPRSSWTVHGDFVGRKIGDWLPLPRSVRETPSLPRFDNEHPARAGREATSALRRVAKLAALQAARGTKGHNRPQAPGRAVRSIVQVVVAGACRNRTYRGSSEPQLVLKTSRVTRPDPPPLPFLAVAAARLAAPRKATQHGRDGKCRKKRRNRCHDGPDGQCEERRPLAAGFGE